MPNINGVIELDAAVMRGRDCAVGSVLGLQKCAGSSFVCLHFATATEQPTDSIATPSRVAHMMLENCRHSVLAGAGALAFAKKCGFTETDLHTPLSRAAFAAHTADGSSSGHDTLGLVGWARGGGVSAAVTTSVCFSMFSSRFSSPF